MEVDWNLIAKFVCMCMQTNWRKHPSMQNLLLKVVSIQVHFWYHISLLSLILVKYIYSPSRQQVH